jgi:hypothetical protein
MFTTLARGISSVYSTPIQEKKRISVQFRGENGKPFFISQTNIELSRFKLLKLI